MNKEKSFICERTAEYTLAPNLKTVLQRKFEIVTPIFPWLTREGGGLSGDIHKHDSFKVVGLYARRPKLNSALSDTISIKINREVSRGAQIGLEVGIPIIAGCPLATNFWELGSNPKCVWIRLDQGRTDDFTLCLPKTVIHAPMRQTPGYLFDCEEDLLAYVCDKSIVMDLSSAIHSFRVIKQADGVAGSWRFFVGGYKPMYFILK